MSAPPCNTQMIFHSSNLTSVNRVGTSSEGVKTITDILKKDPFPNGFTTSQLFQVAVQQPPTDVPANLKENNLPVMPWEAWAPSHPIRSIRCVPCFSSYSTLFDQFLSCLCWQIRLLSNASLRPVPSTSSNGIGNE